MKGREVNKTDGELHGNTCEENRKEIKMEGQADGDKYKNEK